jgi:hypothetical protein
MTGAIDPVLGPSLARVFFSAYFVLSIPIAIRWLK